MTEYIHPSVKAVSDARARIQAQINDLRSKISFHEDKVKTYKADLGPLEGEYDQYTETLEFLKEARHLG